MTLNSNHKPVLKAHKYKANAELKFFRSLLYKQVQPFGGEIWQ